jgi:hypothetical protein
MDKQNKYALSQADTADDEKNMDNINMIKSAIDIKKQSTIQNLMQVKASYGQVLGQIDKEMEDFSTSLNPNHLYQAIFLQGEIG